MQWEESLADIATWNCDHTAMRSHLHLFLVQELRYIDAFVQLLKGSSKLSCLQVLAGTCTVFVLGLDDVGDQLDPGALGRSSANNSFLQKMLRHLSTVLKMPLPSRLSWWFTDIHEDRLVHPRF